MAQPKDPIDQTLAELHQALGDTLTMLNIVVALRRNSAHLITVLHTMLAELSLKIDTTLPTFPEEPEEGESDV
jgi:ABC-type transporter Mla subunit MlaD